MSKYYVIRQTEDGLSLNEYATAEKVKQAVADDAELADIATESLPVFLSKCPKVFDGQMQDVADTAVLIIKGEIVVPTVVKRVTEWEIE